MFINTQETVVVSISFNYLLDGKLCHSANFPPCRMSIAADGSIKTYLNNPCCFGGAIQTVCTMSVSCMVGYARPPYLYGFVFIYTSICKPYSLYFLYVWLCWEPVSGWCCHSWCIFRFLRVCMHDFNRNKSKHNFAHYYNISFFTQSTVH